MAVAETNRCRLCLVTPVDADPAAVAVLLGDALSGGDVASVIICSRASDLEAVAAALTPIAQSRGAAALIHNDTRIAGHSKADGVLIDTGIADLREAIGSFRPRRIVGAGGLTSRHDAMTAGEAGADYLFFGRLDGDTGGEIFDKAFDLAAWWASMFVIPAMVMCGDTIQSITRAADAGIEFAALRKAVWDDPRGPAAAVADANRLLAVPEAVR
jgi:thiamine-phosphate pyrophosphorylase